MNSVNIVGRLTKDIEITKTQGGTSVGKFTIAVNRKFKQEGQPEADFIRCIAWGKTTEIMAQYLSKGSQLGVTGRIQTGSYDKDGKTVYTTDVVVESFDFLEPKKDKEKVDYGYSQQQAQDDLRQEVDESDTSYSDLPF